MEKNGQKVLSSISLYRCHILLLLVAAQTLSAIDRVNLSVAGTVLVGQYHYTPAMLGVMLSATFWAYTLAQIAAGPLADWARSRVTLALCVSVWSFGTILCGTTTAFVPLIFLRIIVGVGEAPGSPGVFRLIAETFSKDLRATAVGVYFSGNKIGPAVGLALCGLILARFGLPWVFYITGAMGLAWVIWFLLIYRGKILIEEASPPARGKMEWIKLLKHRQTWGTMLGTGGNFYMLVFYTTWLPSYLVLQRHISILNSGVISSLPFIVAVFTTILGGWLSDRFIAGGARVTIVRKSFAIGGIMSAAIFTVLLAYIDDTSADIALLALAIGALGLCTAAVNAVAVDVAPRHLVSSLTSIQTFGANLIASFAPVITGILISSTNNFQLPMLVCAGVAVIVGCGAYIFIIGDIDRPIEMQGP